VILFYIYTKNFIFDGGKKKGLVSSYAESIKAKSELSVA
jgi:hypothetical protein